MAFIHDDFLLATPQARELYHRFAENEPIYDYHCHLPPALLADNHQFADLAEVWLAGDHYKWRAMRSNGVAERFCTGAASPWEKFQAWAGTVPHTLRNPLYHWTHLELKRFFGIDTLLNSQTAAEVWRQGNERLAKLRVHDLLTRSKVAVVCTTDDPADSLDTHERIRASRPEDPRLPGFPPRQGARRGQSARLQRLGGAAGGGRRNLDPHLRRPALRAQAAARRFSRFRLPGLGPRAGAGAFRPVHPGAGRGRLRHGHLRADPVSRGPASGTAPILMLEFGRWDAARGWTKQLHLGALRGNNSRLLGSLGPDTGFDSIGDFPQTRALSRYLDALDSTNQLPRTILYNVNPTDNYAFATMIGNFQDGTIPGKLQFGSGWWFLDQREGMEWQLNALSNLGLLSRFVGMITDSRSFLSYPRHEYFRRVLCNLLGGDIARGEIPDDRELVGGMIRNICFGNARDYFGLELAPEFAKKSG